MGALCTNDVRVCNCLCIAYFGNSVTIELGFCSLRSALRRCIVSVAHLQLWTYSQLPVNNNKIVKTSLVVMMSKRNLPLFYKI